MRVLFWKFHCPSFICFCKSTPISLSSCRSLKLESSQNVSSSSPSIPDSVEGLPAQIGDEECRAAGVTADVTRPRSSLKKPSRSGSKKIGKGKVQWKDLLGEELVEIQEIEPSESGESEDENDRSCGCVIQ